MTPTGRSSLVLLLVATASLSHAEDLDRLARPEARKASVKCQTAIAQAGAKLVAIKLKSLDACSTGVLACLQVKSGDPGCLAKAEAKCTKALLDTIPQTETKLVAKIVKKCGAPLRPADLLADDGFSIARRAAACNDDFGLDICVDLPRLAQCLVQDQGRVAERLFAAAQPRANELITQVLSPLPLAHLPPHLGCTNCSSTPSGKAITACAGSMTKAGRAFAAAVQKHVGTCIAKAFACVQTKGGAPDCLSKAATACDKGMAKLEAARGKLSSAIDKRCSEAILSFDTLRLEDGLNLDALADDCATLGAVAGTLAEQIECLRRQHECQISRAIRGSLPRSAALAGSGVSAAVATLLDDATCPAVLPSEALGTLPARLARKAPTLSGPFNVADFYGALHKTAGGIVPPTRVNQPRPSSSLNAPKKVRIVSSTPIRFVPGKAKSIFIRYSGFLPRPAAARGVAPGAGGPTLILSAQREDLDVSDHLEFALDAVPEGEEGLAELIIEYSANPPTCIFDIGFAVSEGGAVSDYTTLPRIVDTEEPPTPPSATPTPAPPHATPTPTATTTSTATPTTTATPSPTPTVVPIDFACGDLVGGTIESPGSVRTHAFGGEAGAKITLTLVDHAFSGTPVLSVSSPSGSPLGNQIIKEGASDYTLQQSGVHVVTVKMQNSSHTGGYTVGLDCIAPPGPTDGNLTCGAVTERVIVEAGDANFFTFTGDTGDVVSLALADGITQSTVSATVFQPSGSSLTQLISHGFQNFELKESGVHRVRVRVDEVEYTGSYNLGFECVRPLEAADGVVACGATFMGSINPAAESDFVTFSGESGQTVTLTLTEVAGGFTGFPVATVSSPSGNRLGDITSSTPAPFPLEETGTHVVRVNSDPDFFRFGGNYALQLECQ